LPECWWLRRREIAHALARPLDAVSRVADGPSLGISQKSWPSSPVGRSLGEAPRLRVAHRGGCQPGTAPRQCAVQVRSNHAGSNSARGLQVPTASPTSLRPVHSGCVSVLRPSSARRALNASNEAVDDLSGAFGILVM